VDQSIHLADNLRSALAGGGLSVTFGRAYLVPLDDMMCPAVAVEIAPPEVGSDAILIRDAAYQQKIANAIAGGLTTWRKQMTPAPASQSSTPDRRVAP
jgi:N-acetylmuramoyl-L-alanine amidase